MIPRFGRPEDVAKAVRLLLEPDSYITGQVLTVDGGLTLRRDLRPLAVSGARRAPGPPSSRLSTSSQRRRAARQPARSGRRVVRRAVGLQPARPRRRGAPPRPSRRGARARTPRPRTPAPAAGRAAFVRAVDEHLGHGERRSRLLEDDAHLLQRAVAGAGPPAAPAAPRAARRSPTAARSASGPRATTAPSASATQRHAQRRGIERHQEDDRGQPPPVRNARPPRRTRGRSPPVTSTPCARSRSSDGGGQRRAVHGPHARSPAGTGRGSRRRAAGSRGTRRGRPPASSRHAPPISESICRKPAARGIPRDRCGDSTQAGRGSRSTSSR